MKKIIIFIFCAILVGCTDNERAKIFGGSFTINLPVNTKLESATWKEAELWYLVRPMRQEEQAETWIFHEKSSLGIVEGKVIFKERKE